MSKLLLEAIATGDEDILFDLAGEQELITNYFKPPGRWQSVLPLFNFNDPFTLPTFSQDKFNFDKTSLEKRILVIGAGGLGCEILKCLALTGFRDIHVIDMDTIDLSNLNRQFLFRNTDIGKYKAEVAAKFIMDRVPGVCVVPHNCMIQEKDPEFFQDFDLVISGLDAIIPRSWINALLCMFVEHTESGTIDPDSVIPLIDGGTTGFQGQVRVIIPKRSACFECTMEMFVDDENEKFPLCTLKSKPRLPEHCIQYVMLLQWKNQYSDVSIDGDNPEHLKWIYEQSIVRAEQFNISGITYQLVKGVVKNIIPAIASTNAIIAAQCCHEAFKILSKSAPPLDNYSFLNGKSGVYTHSFHYDRKVNCPICNAKNLRFTVPNSRSKITLGDFRKLLTEDKRIRVTNPSISQGSHLIYSSTIAENDAEMTNDLSKTLEQLDILLESSNFTITDVSLPKGFRIYGECHFQENPESETATTSSSSS